MSRLDPRHRGSEKGNDAKHTYSFKASTPAMNMTCYERLSKKISYRELQEGKCSKGIQKKTLQSLTEGLIHTNRVFKVARSHQKGCSPLRRKYIFLKLIESTESAKPESICCYQSRQR